MATVNKKIADSIRRHSVHLLQFEAGQVAEVKKMLAGVEGRLITILSGNDPTKTANTNLQKAKLKALEESVKSTIDQDFSKMGQVVHSNLTSLAEVEIGFAMDAINSVVGSDVVSTAITPGVLKKLVGNGLIFGTPAEDWWAGQSADLRKKFMGQMREGVLMGENLGDLVRRVRGTKEYGFKDGIMSTSTRNAEALVRTSVQSIANDARMMVYQDNDDVIKGFEWVATLDGRTTPICQALDGLTWNLNYKPIGHDHKYPGPTAHWNCRSTQVPVLKSWEELTNGKIKDSISPSTRASMDGQVSDSLNYEAWLKSKPKEFQIEVLGPAKWALWNEGKIGFSDLINENNRPLTVEQLAELSSSTAVKNKALDQEIEALLSSSELSSLYTLKQAGEMLEDTVAGKQATIEKLKDLQAKEQIAKKKFEDILQEGNIDPEIADAHVVASEAMAVYYKLMGTDWMDLPTSVWLPEFEDQLAIHWANKAKNLEESLKLTTSPYTNSPLWDDVKDYVDDHGDKRTYYLSMRDTASHEAKKHLDGLVDDYHGSMTDVMSLHKKTGAVWDDLGPAKVKEKYGLVGGDPALPQAVQDLQVAQQLKKRLNELAEEEFSAMVKKADGIEAGKVSSLKAAVNLSKDKVQNTKDYVAAVAEVKKNREQMEGAFKASAMGLMESEPAIMMEAAKSLGLELKEATQAALENAWYNATMDTGWDDVMNAYITKFKASKVGKYTDWAKGIGGAGMDNLKQWLLTEVVDMDESDVDSVFALLKTGKIPDSGVLANKYFSALDAYLEEYATKDLNVLYDLATHDNKYSQAIKEYLFDPMVVSAPTKYDQLKAFKALHQSGPLGAYDLESYADYEITKTAKGAIKKKTAPVPDLSHMVEDVPVTQAVTPESPITHGNKSLADLVGNEKVHLGNMKSYVMKEKPIPTSGATINTWNSLSYEAKTSVVKFWESGGTTIPESIKKFLIPDIEPPAPIKKELVDLGQNEKVHLGNIKSYIKQSKPIPTSGATIDTWNSLSDQAKVAVLDDLSASGYADQADKAKILFGLKKPVVPEVPVGKSLDDLQWNEKTHIGIVQNSMASGKFGGMNTASASYKTWDSLSDQAKATVIKQVADKQKNLGQAVTIPQHLLDKYLPEAGTVSPVAQTGQVATTIAPKVVKPSSSDLSLSNLVKYDSAKGSNTGGFYHVKDNPAERYYLKFPDSPEVARNEVLAANLYHAAGVEVPEVLLVSDGGKEYIASRIIDGLDNVGAKVGKMSGAHDGFVVDAWLGDWDVAGASYDNLLAKDGARAVRIDVGGSLRFRAQGGMKGDKFGKVVEELDTLLDPQTNPKTAAVFKGITQDSLDAGARKVLMVSDDTIRELVEKFGPYDAKERAKLVETLIARKEYIRQKFPHIKVDSTPVKVTNTGTITENDFVSIKQARGNGYTITIDKEDIEDHQVLFYQRKTESGDQTAAWFKLRGNAARNLDAAVEGGTTNIRTLASFEEANNKVVEAIKGIAFRSTKGEALEAKDITRAKAALVAIEKKSDEIKELVKAGKVDAAELGKFQAHFNEWRGILKDALDTGEGNKMQWVTTSKFSGYSNITEKIDPKSSAIQWIKKNRSHGDVDVDNGHVKAKEDASVIIDDYYEAEVDGVKIQYVPDNDNAKFANRGRIHLYTTGDPEVSIPRITAVMDKIGIDNSISTAVDEEELYLYQLAYKLNPQKSKSISLSPTLSPEQRLDALRKEVSSIAGVKDISALPDYNPAGTRQAFGHGRRFFYAPVINKTEWDSFAKDYRIVHHNTGGKNMASLMDDLLRTGGHFTPTTEKLRKGIKISGMSPEADLGTGGASYFFTRIKSKAGAIGSGNFVWKPKALLRMDAISYNGDMFGRVTGDTVANNRITDIEGWRKAAGRSSNETIFKDSMSIFDDLQAIIVGNQAEKNEVIAAIRKHKMDRWPDGRPLEQVVLTTTEAGNGGLD